MSNDRLVHVVDDDVGVRKSLAFLLGSAGFSVRVYESAVALLAADPASMRGVIVSDVGMPEIDGMELQRRLKALNVTLPLIMITGNADIRTAVEALKAGAADFIEKPFDDEHLLSQVRAALETFDAGEPDKPEPGAPLELLSSRQREVLQRVLDGKPSRQIAEELAISVKTVEFHRSRIMQKLGVKSAAELFRRCLGAG